MGLSRDIASTCLGMAFVRGEMDCLEEANTIHIKRKDKWGHPSRVLGPLVKDNGG